MHARMRAHTHTNQLVLTYVNKANRPTMRPEHFALCDGRGSGGGAQWFQSESKRTKHLLPVRHIFLNNFRLKKKFFITHFKIRINIFELCWKLFIFYTSWQANSTESFFSLFLCQIINPDVIPHRLICHTIYFI